MGMLKSQAALCLFLLFVIAVDVSIAGCPTGDLNGDCQVDIEDLQLLAKNWLSGGNNVANLDSDDRVNLGDLSIMVQNWLSKKGPVVINEFMAVNSYIPFTNPLNIKTRVYGQDVYPDWIELRNISYQAVDLGGMYLTDDDHLLSKWSFPQGTTIPAGGYLVVFASGKTVQEYPDNYPYRDDFGALHTNFELSGSGEFLALVNPDGRTVMHSYGPSYPRQRGLVSYGIDSACRAGYLTVPTPGVMTNNQWTGGDNSDLFAGTVADTKFSVDRGFYNTSFEVQIGCSTDGAAIYFTTDSSEPVDINGEPTATAQLYNSISNKPQITTTTCLRAAAIKSGHLPSGIDTQTYIFTENVLDQTAPSVYAGTWGGYPADYMLEDDRADIKLVAGNSDYTVNQARGVIKNALMAIPTLSVVAHPDNLFATGDGIYLKTNSLGIDWERSCSAELFDPAEGSKFQLNCGLRIQGGASRNPASSPKHSMSLRFRGGYGPGKLQHKLFPGSAVDSFNGLQLRAMYNNSWIHWSSEQRLHGSMIRDQWMRDVLLDMGNESAGHGTYVHLYLNGLYWGVYNLHERQEASHYNAYYGADSDTLDAISSGTAADGSLNSWDALQNEIAAADGTIDLIEYQSIASKLDLVNFCDYMILNQYGGNVDWHDNNWRGAGGGINNSPWRLFSWDAERILEGLTKSVVGAGSGDNRSPRKLHPLLHKSQEFRMLFADRIHKHYFNGGSLTPERAGQLWMNRANELDQAIIAESARWGDYRRDVHVRGTAYLFTRNDHWLPEQERLMNSHINVNAGQNRSEVMLQNQYIPEYYPSVDAPVYNINGSYEHGGYVDAGAVLSMINPEGSGTIYYTLDGSDPRLFGGTVNPAAHIIETAGTTQNISLVPMGSNWKYLYDGSNQLTDWQLLNFTDKTWNSGNGELGFGDGDETTVIGPKVDGRITAYFRHVFTASDISGISKLWINLKYDDGAVIYINQQEVGRVNMPAGEISYDTLTLPIAVENATAVFVNISPIVLNTGSNIIAVEVHQKQSQSSDISFDLALNATMTDSSPTQTQEILTESTTVRARVLDGGIWSALNQADYAVGPVFENLRVSEIMYNPPDPNAEYIELTNIGTEAINLNRVSFVRGINYTFPSLTLEPNEYVVVVRDLTGFEDAYDTVGMKIAGQYTGGLSNDGEKIELHDTASKVIQLFGYQDNWYELTDGVGFSLTMVNPASGDLSDWDRKSGWRSSLYAGGTPGKASETTLAPGSIVINEVLAHSHDANPDWIELHNTTMDQDIDISGWFLSDDDSDPDAIRKYRIPSSTVIHAGTYKVFVGNISFNAQPPTGGNVPFGLSEGGETLYLYSGDGLQVTGLYQAQQKFDASESGVTLGRYEKTELSGGYDFVRQSSPSAGTANAGPLIADIVITELYYNPHQGPDYEFVELYNRGSSPVTLESTVMTETVPGVLIAENISWRLEGTGYEFPVGVTIAPHSYILVAKDPLKYNSSSCDVYGPYDGKLDNGGEEIELQMPGDQEYGKKRYWIPIEKIDYEDKYPWPDADGNGKSLQRVNINKYGRDHTNWTSESPTPDS